MRRTSSTSPYRATGSPPIEAMPSEIFSNIGKFLNREEVSRTALTVPHASRGIAYHKNVIAYNSLVDDGYILLTQDGYRKDIDYVKIIEELQNYLKVKYLEDPDDLYRPLYHLLRQPDIDLQDYEFDDRSSGYMTALILASWGGYIEIVRSLLASGAEINLEDDEGWTALTFAAANGYIDIYKLLIEAGARYSYYDFYHAIGSGRIKIVDLMLSDGGLDPNHTIRRVGRTGLMVAAEYGHDAVTELLLAYGADPNIQNPSGSTALHYARKSGVVELLLNAGADPNIRNNYGQTALDEAATLKRQNVINILSS